MTDTKLSALFTQIDSLPSLPAIVTQVMQITSDAESSAQDLMQAVVHDQSMCALMLKIANSAFFGFPRKVSTIEKAVLVLGFDEIRNIVLGKAVINCFPNLDKKGNKSEVENFWQHSFLCGLGSKIIAEDLGFSPSELFIGGLLHDIGKLAMLMAYGGDYINVIKLSDPVLPSSIHKENDHFTIGHDKVALKILNKWLFPNLLTHAIGYHHSPSTSPSTPYHPGIIQIADVLALFISSTERGSVADIHAIIQDFYPEILILWEKKDISIDSRVDSWLEKIKISREKDSAIMEIFSS